MRRAIAMFEVPELNVKAVGGYFAIESLNMGVCSVQSVTIDVISAQRYCFNVCVDVGGGDERALNKRRR